MKELWKKRKGPNETKPENFEKLSNINSGQNSNINNDCKKIVTIPGQFISSLTDLEEMVKSLMERSVTHNGHQKGFTCKVCGKEDNSTNIKKHIEANHLEGVSIPCNFCEKTFRSTRSLVLHKSQNHE